MLLTHCVSLRSAAAVCIRSEAVTHELPGELPSGTLACMAAADEAEWTVERHLDGQPQSAVDLYRQFIKTVESIGHFTYAVSKTTITLKGERRGFAGARPFRDGVRGYFDLHARCTAPRLFLSLHIRGVSMFTNSD